MKLPFGWTVEALTDVVQFLGVGLMALGVGIQYSTTGAIAVFALGLPILGIQRHMREQARLNLLLLQALQGMSATVYHQHASERMQVEVIRDLHALLKRVADEGITRE